MPNREEDPGAELLHHLIDIDVCQGNEEKILLCFRKNIGVLNMRTKQFSLMPEVQTFADGGGLKEIRGFMDRYGMIRSLK